MIIDDYEACPECDLLLHSAAVSIGEKARCPRCNALLRQPHQQSIERSFALAIAGFILIFPANLLPMISIKMMGDMADDSLWTGVIKLFSDGMWIVAVLVCLSSIILPMLHIVLVLLISGHLYFNRANHYLAVWMRAMQHLHEWVMLEVYMLGIIVACVKLMAMSDIKLGLGLYAFIALLLVNSLLTSNLDHTLFWRRIGALCEN